MVGPEALITNCHIPLYCTPPRPRPLFWTRVWLWCSAPASSHLWWGVFLGEQCLSLQNLRVGISFHSTHDILEPLCTEPIMGENYFKRNNFFKKSNHIWSLGTMKKTEKDQRRPLGGVIIQAIFPGRFRRISTETRVLQIFPWNCFSSIRLTEMKDRATRVQMMQ